MVPFDDSGSDSASENAAPPADDPGSAASSAAPLSGQPELSRTTRAGERPVRRERSPERVAVTIVAGAVISLVVAFALAPWITVSWCNDAPAGGTSACYAETRTLLGASAPWWLWAAAQAVVVAATVVIARGRVQDIVRS